MKEKLFIILLPALLLLGIFGIRAEAEEEPEPEAVQIQQEVSAEREEIPAEDKPATETCYMTEDELRESLYECGFYREDVPLSEDLQAVLQTACTNAGIEYEIGLGLIYTESRFDPEAVSKYGCYGLCQLNPTWFPSGLTPEENIKTGIAYLGGLLERYDGDLQAALTAYNAGHDTGKRGYARAVLTAAEKWRTV